MQPTICFESLILKGSYNGLSNVGGYASGATNIPAYGSSECRDVPATMGPDGDGAAGETCELIWPHLQTRQALPSAPPIDQGLCMSAQQLLRHLAWLVAGVDP
eukprot:9998397-Ditylum_brightwellii.AAC.1